MANKYSSHLYELIKSLSKAEKRYFKVYVARHTSSDSQNNAQILFDSIDKQKEYDEEKLLESLQKFPFIKKFSIAKARLYDTILKSLDAYYSEKSKEQIIRNEIHFVEILYNKSLYKQCSKRLNSAKKQAKKYNKKKLLLELVEWEKKLIEKDNYQSTSIENLLKLSSEEQEIIGTLSINSKLWELKSILFQKLNKIGRARSKEEVNYLKQDIENKIAEIKIGEDKIKSTYLFNHITGAYYFAIQDNKKSLETVLKTIDLISNNPNQFGDEPNILISALTNGIYLSLKNKDINQAQELYDKLKILYNNNEENGSKDLLIKLKSSLWSIELLLIKLTCDFTKFTTLYTELSQFIEEHKEKINHSRLAFFYYNIAHILFIKDEFSESLGWINKLLNNIAIDESQEIYSFAEILNLFIHYELGNKDLVNYNLKSTKRFLKTRNKLFEYEELILKFFQKTTNHNFDSFEIESQLNKLMKDLEILTDKNLQHIPIEYFDCLTWAKSKIKQDKLSSLTRDANKELLNFEF